MSALKRQRPFPVKLLHVVQILVGFHRKGPLMHDVQGLQFKIPFLFLFFWTSIDQPGATNAPLQDQENSI